MLEFLELFGPTLDIFDLLFRFWWVWTGPVFFWLFVASWITYRQHVYKSKIGWSLLEIKMPREVLKSPKAMEQFFAAIFGLRNVAGDFLETYRDGEVTLWFSFEIVSFGGNIHFYIYTPTKHKNILVANLYANYSTIEIEEPQEDYINRFPDDYLALGENNLDLWGTELILGKDDAYPIRTYVDFEDAEEERTLDPIASLLEVFGKINLKENVLLQILVRPGAPEWRKVGEAFVDKLKKKDVKVRQGSTGEYEERPIRTPGETETLKAIENKISKSHFDTLIRYIYIADKSIYDVNFAKRGTISAFNQYSAQDLNFFRHNLAIYTQVKWLNFPYFFSKRRTVGRKSRLYKNFRKRAIPEETTAGKLFSFHIFSSGLKQRMSVLCTEELATIYHPPTSLVLTAPLIERVESKRMGPPAGLKIFEEIK